MYVRWNLTESIKHFPLHLLTIAVDVVYPIITDYGMMFCYATLVSSCLLTLSPYLTFRWSDKYLCALHKIYANNFTAGRMWNCMYPRHINLYNRKRSLLCIDAQIRFIEREKHENQIRFFENFPDFFFSRYLTHSCGCIDFYLPSDSVTITIRVRWWLCRKTMLDFNPSR